MGGAGALGRKQVRTPQELCVHYNDNTQGGKVHAIFETKALLASTDGSLLGGLLLGTIPAAQKLLGTYMSPASPVVATRMPMAASSSETEEKVRYVVHGNCFDQMLKIHVAYYKVYQNSENRQNLMHALY